MWNLRTIPSTRPRRSTRSLTCQPGRGPNGSNGPGGGPPAVSEASAAGSWRPHLPYCPPGALLQPPVFSVAECTTTLALFATPISTIHTIFLLDELEGIRIEFPFLALPTGDLCQFKRGPLPFRTGRDLRARSQKTLPASTFWVSKELIIKIRFPEDYDQASSFACSSMACNPVVSAKSTWVPVTAMLQGRAASANDARTALLAPGFGISC